MCNQNGNDIDEHVLVHIVASPDDVLIKSVPVLCLEEEIEQVLCGQEVILTEDSEWSSTFWEESFGVVVFEELLHQGKVLMIEIRIIIGTL